MAFIDLLASLTLLHLGKDQASLALHSVSATFGRKPVMTKNRFMIYALYNSDLRFVVYCFSCGGLKQVVAELDVEINPGESLGKVLPEGLLAVISIDSH
ncbi:MAG: hypothetical protein MJZ99_11340, partial [Bacteroidales bacterium]|nr:hypothetical protein [Bacteroidales bacterium]